MANNIEITKFTNKEFIEMLANDKEGIVPTELKVAAQDCLTKEDPVRAFARKLGIEN